MPEQSNHGKLILSIYSGWALIVFILTFISGGPSTDNITKFLVIVFLSVQLLIYYTVSIKKKFYQKNVFFILFLLFAAVVEGFHMISAPVFSSLKISFSMNPIEILTKYVIDLLFTIPAYIAIYWVIWYFVNKYKYKLWEYVLIIALGQALGDGGLFFFISTPFMLIFLPYVMINYHSMNVVPYLLVKNRIEPHINSRTKYLIPPISIIIIYLICGSVIRIIGALFSFV